MVVRLKLFSISEFPRADAAQGELAERYRDISELWDTRLDGLIVTGTEPRAAELEDEPYWPALGKLIDWARENTTSAIWSCLAAHAAVLHADGIERQPLEHKLFGVFEYEVLAPHPLMKGVPPRLQVPHSRYNGLSEPALVAAAISFSPGPRRRAWTLSFGRNQAVRCSSFSKAIRNTRPIRSLREYRRDIGRFLRRRAGALPGDAAGLFQRRGRRWPKPFARAPICDGRESLVADFPMAGFEAASKIPGGDRLTGFMGTGWNI